MDITWSSDLYGWWHKTYTYERKFLNGKVKKKRCGICHMKQISAITLRTNTTKQCDLNRKKYKNRNVNQVANSTAFAIQ